MDDGGEGGACHPCGVYKSIGVHGMVKAGMCIEGHESDLATRSSPLPKPPLKPQLSIPRNYI